MSKRLLSLVLALCIAVTLPTGLVMASSNDAGESVRVINVSITSDSGYQDGSVNKMTYGNTIMLTFETTGKLFPSTKPVIEFQIGGRNVSEAVTFVTEAAPNKFEAAFKLNFGDHRTGTDTTYPVGDAERAVDFGGIGGAVTFSITGIGADGFSIPFATETGDGTSVVVDQTLPSVPDSPVVSPTEDLEDPFWDDATYDMIEKTVMDNVPFFLESDGITEFRITDAKYAHLVRKARETGASEDVDDYTEVFKAAIADANAVGTGAKVVVPYAEDGGNVYYTGAITLLSNVNLVISEGTTLMFLKILSNEYYPVVLQSFEGQELYNFSPPIYALKQKNIAITGGGTIDGQYSGHWSTQSGDKMPLNRESDRNVPVVNRIYTDNFGNIPETIPVIDGDEVKWVPLPEDATIHENGRLRPCFVQPYACENIIIKDISVRGSPMWNIAPVSCRNVLVDGLDINAVGIGNGDGVNPVSTQFVVIQNVKFATGDDCIAIKSFKNGDGLRRNEPSQYIIVRDCDFANGHGGVTCGSEISGGIKWVFAERNIFDSTSLQYALRFKMNSFRGATIENIYERDSVINKSSTAVLYIESSYTSGNAQDRVGDLGRYTPHINNVYISDFTTKGGAEEGNINCTNFIRMTAYTRAPINGIHIRDCEFYGVGASTVESLVNWDITNVKTSARGAGNPVTTINTIPSRITDVRLSDGTNTIGLTDTIAGGKNNVGVIRRSGTGYTITGKVETEAADAPIVRVYTTTSKTGYATAAVTPADGGGYSFSAALDIPEDESAYFINVTSYIGAATADNLNQTTAVHNVVFADEQATPIVSVEVDPRIRSLVSGYAANIPVTVNTGDVGGLKVFAGLYVDGALFGPAAEVVNGGAIIKVGAFTTAGANVYVKAWVEGFAPDAATAVAIPVSQTPADLWTPTAHADLMPSAPFRAKVRFAADIQLTSASITTVFGERAISAVVNEEDGKVLDITFSRHNWPANDKIVVSGVKYPDLFPSYSFTFTIVPTISQ